MLYLNETRLKEGELLKEKLVSLLSGDLDFQAHVQMMADLMVLAFQCDLTRVSAFLEARELSIRT